MKVLFIHTGPCESNIDVVKNSILDRHNILHENVYERNRKISQDDRHNRYNNVTTTVMFSILLPFECLIDIHRSVIFRERNVTLVSYYVYVVVVIPIMTNDCSSLPLA